MARGVIYKLTSPCGKVYIGQTRQKLKDRMRRHEYDSKDENEPSCPHLNAAIRLYGFANFKIEILIECEVDELNQHEVNFIKLFNSIENGYNLSIGGQGGVRPPVDRDYVNRFLDEEPDPERDTLDDQRVREVVCKAINAGGAVITRKHNNYELPMHVTEHHRAKRNEHGFIVKIPGKKVFTFIKKEMTMDEKFADAITCYDTLQSGRDYKYHRKGKRNINDKLNVPVGIVGKGLRGFAFYYIAACPGVRKSFDSVELTRRQNLIAAMEFWMETVPYEGFEDVWAEFHTVYEETLYAEKEAQRKIDRLKNLQDDIDILDAKMKSLPVAGYEIALAQMRDHYESMIKEREKLLKKNN